MVAVDVDRKGIALVVSRKRDAGSFIIAAYLTGIIAAEAIVAFVDVFAGIAVHGTIVVTLLNHHAFSHSRSELSTEPIALLGIVPILRIGSVVLPDWEIFPAYRDVVPLAVGLVTLFALRALLGMGIPGSRTAVPARGRVEALVASAGLVLGLAALLATSGLEQGDWEPDTKPLATYIGLLVAAGFSGAALEILFRGAIQGSIVRRIGWPGVLMTSALYSSLFLVSQSWVVVVIALTTGLFWGALAAYTGSRTGVAISHSLFLMSWIGFWPLVV